MNIDKSDIINLVSSKKHDKELTTNVINGLFNLLDKKVSINKTINIDEIGIIGAHERKGANKEEPDNNGNYPQKNLSIFFHPSKYIKNKVSKLVEDEQ